MENNFQSNENKKMIWQFMQQNNFFIGIPDNKSKIFQQEFEKNITRISKDSDQGISVIDLNKQLLSNMYSYVENMRKNRNVQFHQESELNDNNMITAEEQSKKGRKNLIQN